MDQLGCCVVAEKMFSKELRVGKEAQAVRGSQTPMPVGSRTPLWNRDSTLSDQTDCPEQEQMQSPLGSPNSLV